MVAQSEHPYNVHCLSSINSQAFSTQIEFPRAMMSSKAGRIEVRAGQVSEYVNRTTTRDLQFNPMSRPSAR